MGVRKFKDLDEMRKANWLDKNDPRLFEKICALFKMSADITGELPIARGVYHFRTLEELNEHRKTWDKIRFDEFHRRRATQDFNPERPES